MKKMSVKLRFNSPSDGGLIHRSRSFTGFGSLSGRPRSASIRGSFRSKNTMGSKPPRMHLSPRGGSAATWSQPEQVDRVFQALRSGLKEYLEVHQAEMELLSSQQRETKRNSRLAFLYDLEKEIKALERYIRRLEFQMSKVEELYETYCVQWKLCQGAVNMKRAFSLSPSTRASRESLLELGRSHRHSLQDMSTMEGDLEILLGELQIKMKGLIGFARLCPGDQYEVVVRLGRQRWKIRGRIESDDSQSWDEEEMVFLPHVYHNFEIKVMEAKGLGWLLVGMVTCAGVDFFVARPQLMLVDITELGTIKLQLEVTWNPFDSSEKMKPLSVSKQSVSSRKGSVYSWTAPNTPSFTEKYFMSMVRELQDQEGSLPSLVAKSRSSRGGVSLLSYLSDPSHTSATSGPQSLFLPSLTRAHSYPSTSLAGSQIQLSFEEEEEQRIEGKVDEEEWGGVSETSSAETIKTTSHLALPRSSTPDILRKNPSGETDTETQSAVLQQRGQQESSSIPAVSEAPSSPSSPSVRPKPSGAQRRSQTVRLAVLMAELEKSFGGESDAEKERRALEHQIQHLGTILKNDLSLLRSSASEETLAVEEVLGSFDFLSNDFNADDDTSCLGSVRLKDSGQPIGFRGRAGPRPTDFWELGSGPGAGDTPGHLLHPAAYDENKRLQSVSAGAAAGDVQPDRGSGQSQRSAAREERQHHTERRPPQGPEVQRCPAVLGGVCECQRLSVLLQRGKLLQDAEEALHSQSEGQAAWTVRASVFQTPAAAAGPLRAAARLPARLQPRQGHSVPALRLSEALELPGSGGAHLPPVQGRVHPVGAERPQTEEVFKQAEGAEPVGAPPTAEHAADCRRPAGGLQPQSVQSCSQLHQQSCRLQGLQEQVGGFLHREPEKF
ncbi:RIPOR family member 3 isoform X3 [Poecilia reticulata]|uniref:RIPOR family member 3 isoform X3 n=1 Tax=Poecilia reticulata TaxID=8081 RepID=UPI0007EA496C|nr:PREDICTED: protein FAM65C isoform X3 [Poecilia reticulata]